MEMSIGFRTFTNVGQKHWLHDQEMPCTVELSPGPCGRDWRPGNRICNRAGSKAPLPAERKRTALHEHFFLPCTMSGTRIPRSHLEANSSS